MIVEGILRKWILPNFQTYIYFIKDFLLILIYSYAIKHNVLFNKNYSKLFIFFIIIISLYGLIGYQLDFQGILSYLLGLRSYWLYVPLALIAVNLFEIDDVKKFIKINIYFIIPYFILILCQSFSDDTSIINSGFNSLVMNPERPSAYFTYTTQNTFYFTFLFCCLFSKIIITSNFTTKKYIYYTILIFMMISSMILLKSRAVYLFIFVILIYVFLTTLFLNENNKLKIKKLTIIMIVTPLLFQLSQNIYKKDFDFSAKRINSDTYYQMKMVKEYKDVKIPLMHHFVKDPNLLNIFGFCKKYSSICRIVDEIYIVPTISDALKYGAGIGAGTSAVTAFKKGTSFPLGEAENHRVIMELGYYVGVLFVLIKYLMVIFFHILFLLKD
jgi:hypothetical protein